MAVFLRYFFVNLFAQLCIVSHINGDKILMMTVPQGSSLQLYKTAALLLKEREHEVKFLVDPYFNEMLDKDGLDHYDFERPVSMKWSDAAKPFWNIKDPPPMWKLVYEGTKTIFNDILMTSLIRIMENETLQSEIAADKFDLAIIDLGYDKFLSALPHRHGIPYVSLTPVTFPWLAGIPSLPSSEPMPHWAHSNEMDFQDRVLNFLVHFVHYNMVPPSWLNLNKNMHKLLPDEPNLTWQELYANCSLFFINADTAIMSYPYLSTPNMIFIHALTAKPAEPLDGHLAEIMDVSNSPHGVIIMSFGSSFRDLPENFITPFLDAFSQVKQQVIIAYNGPPLENVSDNVHLESWLPQNDLLGHLNTKIFISHGGLNGLAEAIQHAVPVISFPYGADRDFNTFPLIQRGMALRLDLLKFTSPDLVEAINTILGNELFYENARKASELFNAMPRGDQTFIYWLEHVMFFGGDHLRYPAIKMSLFKMLSLDVIFFLLVLFIGCLLVFYLMVKTLIKLCRKVSGTKKKEKDA